MFDPSTSSLTGKQSRAERSVSDLLAVVWRHKWHVGGSLAVSILMGILYLSYAKPTYQVSARVLVQPQGWPLDEGARARHEKEFLATQAEIVSSPSVIEGALAAVNQAIATDQDIDPMLAVLGNLTVRPVSGTNVLGVSYRCKDSLAGVNLVQAILGSYQQFLQEMNDGSRLETLRLLTRSEEGLRSELEEREKRYQELRKQSPLIGQRKDATMSQTASLERLEQTLSEIRDRRLDLQNRIELMTQPPDAGLVAGHTRPELAAVAYNVSTEGEQFVQHADFRPALEPGDDHAALDLLANANLTGVPDLSFDCAEIVRRGSAGKRTREDLRAKAPGNGNCARADCGLERSARHVEQPRVRCLAT